MKFFFPQNDCNKIVQELSKAMEGRKLGKIVSITNNGDNIKITISKLGKSVIEFEQTPCKRGVEWNLTKEKIAFSHRAVKSEVVGKINIIVESIGGSAT